MPNPRRTIRSLKKSLKAAGHPAKIVRQVVRTAKGYARARKLVRIEGNPGDARGAGRTVGEKWNGLRGIMRPGADSTRGAFREFTKGKGRMSVAERKAQFDEFVAGIRETYRPTAGNPPSMKEFSIAEATAYTGTARAGASTVTRKTYAQVEQQQRKHGGEVIHVVDSRGKHVAYVLVIRRASNPRISTSKSWERQKAEETKRYQVMIHHQRVPTRVFDSLAEARALIARVQRGKQYRGVHYDIYDRKEGTFLEDGVIGKKNPAGEWRVILIHPTSGKRHVIASDTSETEARATAARLSKKTGHQYIAEHGAFRQRSNRETPSGGWHVLTTQVSSASDAKGLASELNKLSRQKKSGDQFKAGTSGGKPVVFAKFSEPGPAFRTSRGNPVHVATLRQAGARAEVYQTGATSFEVKMSKGQEHAESGPLASLDGAMAWARVKLHEFVATIRHKIGGKRNPMDTALKLFEEFHGYPSKEVLEYHGKQHVHTVKTGLAKLVALCLESVDSERMPPLIAPGFRYEGDQDEIFWPDSRMDRADGQWKFSGSTKLEDMVFLTSNEDGNQLFLDGGDQSLDTRALGLSKKDDRDHMLIGTIARVWYRTRKSFEEDGQHEVDFYHDFGAEGSDGICPVLLYKPLDPGLEIFGGRYRIALPSKSLGGVSPGIVG